jgi:hypothetical protein
MKATAEQIETALKSNAKENLTLDVIFRPDYAES